MVGEGAGGFADFVEDFAVCESLDAQYIVATFLLHTAYPCDIIG